VRGVDLRACIWLCVVIGRVVRSSRRRRVCVVWRQKPPLRDVCIAPCPAHPLANRCNIVCCAVLCCAVCDRDDSTLPKAVASLLEQLASVQHGNLGEHLIDTNDRHTTLQRRLEFADLDLVDRLRAKRRRRLALSALTKWRDVVRDAIRSAALASPRRHARTHAHARTSTVDDQRLPYRQPLC